VSELALRLIEENKKTRATFLDLDNCGLTEVPTEIGELVWLEELSFFGWFPSSALIVIHKCWRAVIPAWMPESSHKDVNLWADNLPDSSTCASGKLPSMALDSGIHAGMTVFSRSVGLVYNDERSAWERANIISRSQDDEY